MTDPDRIESAGTGEWTADAVRTLIRKNLEPGIRESGMKPEAIGEDDDLFAMGIVDSYGLVELIVAVEGARGHRQVVDANQRLSRLLESAAPEALVDEARGNGRWLILAGHEMAESGPQTTRLRALEALSRYVSDPANGIWVDTVDAVARHVLEHRRSTRSLAEEPERGHRPSPE